MTSHRDGTDWGHAVSTDQVQAVEKSLQRSVLWSRLMLAAFFTVTVITLIWAIPWFPYGTSVEDYNSRVGMMVLLALSASFFAFVAVRLRDKMRHAESTYVTMSSVHDRIADLRRREYFYDRLLLECDRARQTGIAFSVVVLRTKVDEGSSFEVSPVQRVTEVMAPLAKEYDWLAPIGVQEVAMFAPKLTHDAAASFAEDLRSRVQESLHMPHVSLAAGWATYGPGLDEAGDLLGHARRMVSHAGHETQAA